MEFIDEVDENNELTGNKYERKFIHKNNIYHRHVSAWIMNEKGEILLQKRSANKNKNPNKWAKTGGHVESGELPIEAVKREVEEEIGLKFNDSQIEALNIFKNKTDLEKYFAYNYIIYTKNKIDEYNLQIEEVSEVKYFSIEEMELIKKNNNDEFNFIKWNDSDFYNEIKMLKEKRRRKS